MEKDMNLYTQAFQAAIRVEFLANSDELYLYAGALYDAMVWGMKRKRGKTRRLEERT